MGWADGWAQAGKGRGGKSQGEGGRSGMKAILAGLNQRWLAGGRQQLCLITTTHPRDRRRFSRDRRLPRGVSHSSVDGDPQRHPHLVAAGAGWPMLCKGVSESAGAEGAREMPTPPSAAALSAPLLPSPLLPSPPPPKPEPRPPLPSAPEPSAPVPRPPPPSERPLPLPRPPPRLPLPRPVPSPPPPPRAPPMVEPSPPPTARPPPSPPRLPEPSPPPSRRPERPSPGRC